MTERPAQRVELIPVERITVVNPRLRNRKVFRGIVDNIAEIGLKRPITVSRRMEAGGPFYDLVCGQGRLEAYQALGQAEIPALVVNADTEDCLIASLVENCARRQHRAIDLLYDIEGMKRRGYDEPDIARKTGLTLEYVRGVIRLLEKGEQRLLQAVETGTMPVSVAVDIAEADDAGVQLALQNAYETKALRGRKLLVAKRIIEMRQRRGKDLKSVPSKRSPTPSSEALVKAYREDTDRKRLLIRRANVTRDRLIFIVEALRQLIAEPEFVSLLEGEGLTTMPRALGDRISVRGAMS